MKTKTNTELEIKYADREREIRGLISLLEDALKTNAQKHAAQPLDCGVLDNLNRAYSELLPTVAGLSGKSQTQIAHCVEFSHFLTQRTAGRTIIV